MTQDTHIEQPAEVSFIIPAYNEAEEIQATIEHVQTACAALRMRYEILVVNDASSDDTATRARAAGARVIDVNHRHIAATRNSGAREARAPWLIFLDADTHVTTSLIAAACTALRCGAVGGGTTFRFDANVPNYTRMVASFMSAICRITKLSPGCFIFCTAKVFAECGGFPKKFYVGEEIGFGLTLRRKGRVVILRESILTSGRKFRVYSAWELLSATWNAITGPFAGSKRHFLWYEERRDDRK